LTISHILALFVAILFVGAGVYKILDPFTWAHNLEVFKVPYQISLPATLLLAISEVFGGVLILVPRFRRWGAALVSLLLIAFMAYIGYHYKELIGQDCTCFPWLKRTIGPPFFAGDAGFLLAAILAGVWAKPSFGKRGAAVMLGAVAVFAGVSYGSALTHQNGLKAPDSTIVDGKPYSLQHGRIFLFFYDPNCMHCDHAAKTMSKFNWKSDVTVIAIPTREQHFAEAFLHDTKLKAVTSLEVDKLKSVFQFTDPPYGVVLENGHQKTPVPHYEDAEPEATLRQVGFIE